MRAVGLFLYAQHSKTEPPHQARQAGPDMDHTQRPRHIRGAAPAAGPGEAITTDLVFNIRSMLMAMPGRLAVDTAELASPAETSARIQEEVNEILLSLSQYHYDPEEYKKRVKDRQGWAMIEDDEQAE